MLKKLITNKYFYILLALSIIIICYFFWPRTVKNINEKQTAICILKNIDGKPYFYDFKEQDIRDYAKILRKSKFRHGASFPEHLFSNNSLYVEMISDLGLIRISIYFDTDKTYTSAYFSNDIFFNNRYRISNADEIVQFIEGITSTKSAEFYQSDNHTQEWHLEE